MFIIAIRPVFREWYCDTVSGALALTGHALWQLFGVKRRNGVPCTNSTMFLHLSSACDGNSRPVAIHLLILTQLTVLRGVWSAILKIWDFFISLCFIFPFWSRLLFLVTGLVELS